MDNSKNRQGKSFEYSPSLQEAKTDGGDLKFFKRELARLESELERERQYLGGLLKEERKDKASVSFSLEKISQLEADIEEQKLLISRTVAEILALVQQHKSARTDLKNWSPKDERVN